MSLRVKVLLLIAAVAFAVLAGAAAFPAATGSDQSTQTAGAAEPPADQPQTTEPARTAAPAAGRPDDIDWTGTSQKWVPIFSIENAGLSIGAAQVAGPTGQVQKVKGVAQLGVNFQSVARITVYIPTSALSTKLDRVQGVSVWAVGDIRLINF